MINSINNYDIYRTGTELVATVVAAQAEPSALSTYNAGYFAQVASDSLTKLGLPPSQQSSASQIDFYLCHLILYALNQSIPDKTYFKYLPFLLSSPSLMNLICRQDWFQELKAQIGWSYGKKIVKNKIMQDYVEPVQKIINTDLTDWETKLLRSCCDFLEQRGDLLRDAVENMEQLGEQIGEMGIKCSIQGKSPTIFECEDVLDTTIEIQKSVTGFFKSPKVAIFGSQERSPLNKAYIAWTVSTYAYPALSSFVFLSSEPEPSEVAVRTGCVAFACFTEQYFLSALLAEMLSRSARSYCKDMPLSQGIKRKATKTFDDFVFLVDDLKRQFVQDLKNRGFSNRTRRRFERATAQTIGATVFSLMCMDNHPLVNALSATSFMGYWGQIMEHHRLGSSKSFSSQTSDFSKVPLQLATGLSFMGLDALGVPRPVLTLGLAALGTPAIQDRIVSSHLYRSRVFWPLIGSVMPKAQWAIVTSKFYELTKGTKVANAIDWAVVGIAATGAAIVGRKVIQKINTPQGKMLQIKTMNAASLAYSIYSSYAIYSIFDQYTHFSLASLATIIPKPKDAETLVACVAGATVGATTGSPLFAAGTIEVTDKILRRTNARGRLAATRDRLQPLVTQGVQRVRQASYKTGAYVFGFFSELGAAVREALTNDEKEESLIHAIV